MYSLYATFNIVLLKHRIINEKIRGRYLIVRFLALVTTMVTKVDLGNHHDNHHINDRGNYHSSNHRDGYYDGYDVRYYDGYDDRYYNGYHDQPWLPS